MMGGVARRLAGRLGRPGYVLDPALRSGDLFAVLVQRSAEIVRGLWWRARCGSVAGVLLVGRGCRLRHLRHLRVGRTFAIGDGVAINALCRRGVQIGNNVTLRAGVTIDCTGVLGELGEGLEIGHNVGISEGCFIQVRGPVAIGDDVIMGPGVRIFSENHRADDVQQPIRLQGVTRVGVRINRGVWIGTAAVILDGVTVGHDAIIAAGSVVTRDVPAESVVAGVPSRVIRLRKDASEDAEQQ